MHEKLLNELVEILHSKQDNIDLDDQIERFLSLKKAYLESLGSFELLRELISELNYRKRSSYKSSELIGFKARIGDICYIDFGKAYINEAGFQHFGLIIGQSNSKALVLPMSSNLSMYNQSYCQDDFPVGKKHLFRLPMVPGLKRKSVLFLNDLKYINTARIISIKGNIHPKSPLFKAVIRRVETLLHHNY